MKDPSERIHLTRLFLTILLAALGACAAVGILVLLLGEFDDTEWRILATCATIAFTSLTGLGCAVALERQVVRLIALFGIGVSFFACVFLAIGIWTDFLDSEEFGKACGTLSLFAVALAHTSLLSIARLRPEYGWTRFVTAAAAFLLVTVLSGMIIFEEGDESVARLVGVLSILTALGTLTVPILHRLSGIPLKHDKAVERPEEIEIVCPRCHRRQRLLIGPGYCPHCELEINIEIRGWDGEEAPGSGS